MRLLAQHLRDLAQLGQRHGRLARLQPGVRRLPDLQRRRHVGLRQLYGQAPLLYNFAHEGRVGHYARKPRQVDRIGFDNVSF